MTKSLHQHSKVKTHSENRNVNRAKVFCKGRIISILSLKMKHQPGHCIHSDVGYHRKGIPNENIQPTYNKNLRHHPTDKVLQTSITRTVDH